VLFLFLILQSGDTLDTDTIAVAKDTAEILVIFEIPEIIQYDHKDANIQTILLRPLIITPDPMDVTLNDAFFYTPYTIIDLGPSLPQYLTWESTDSKHTHVFFNNHLLNDPICGSMDLHLVPVQFLRSIETGVNGYGIPSIDLRGKENIYERPYSTTGFMTGSFSHTAYIFELTRAIDNDLGFYLDGLYRRADGYRSNDEFSTMALYTNVYDNHIIPMRLDAIITSRTFGYPDQIPDTTSYMDKRLIDISYAAGIPGHNVVAFYNDHANEWHDSLNQRTLVQTSRTCGIGSDNCHNVGPFQFLYKISGLRYDIESDIYGAQQAYLISSAQTINAVYKKLLLSLSLTEEFEQDGFYYAPFASAGIRFFDSLSTYITFARRYRKPRISETAPLLDSTDFTVRTNDSLCAEYYNRQGLGIRSQFGSITLFRYDFTDRITITRDSIDRPSYMNSGSWQNTGLQGDVSIPWYIHQNNDMTAFTRCLFGLYGAYLLEEDTLLTNPRYTINGALIFTRQTERFGINIAAYSTHVGPRTYPLSAPRDPYTIIGCSATVRFVTLSCKARFDNIFDSDHAFNPEYPLAGRSFNINIQWQFWY